MTSGLFPEVTRLERIAYGAATQVIGGVDGTRTRGLLRDRQAF